MGADAAVPAPPAGPPVWQRRLILLGLLLVPLLSLSEVLALLRGLLRDHREVLTPFYVKGVKDLLLLAILLLGLGSVLRSRRFALPPAWALFFLCALGSLFLSWVEQPPLVILAGLRALLPLLLILFLWRAVDAALQAAIARVLRGLLVLGFLVQLVQALVAPPYFGTGFLGLNARNPGLFIVPGTMAWLACIATYQIHAYLPATRVNRLVVHGVGPLSVLLTASGAGLLGLACLWGVMAFHAVREKGIVLSGGLIAGVAVAALLPLLTGRPELAQSLLIRLGILGEAFSRDTILLSSQFGLWTNAADTLAQVGGLVGGLGSRIADSTLTTLIGNYGLLAFACFAVAVAASVPPCRRGLLFLAAFLPVALTANLNEAWPMNLLFAVNIVYFLTLRLARRGLPVLVDPDPAGDDAGQHRQKPRHSGQ